MEKAEERGRRFRGGGRRREGRAKREFRTPRRPRGAMLEGSLGVNRTCKTKKEGGTDVQPPFSVRRSFLFLCYYYYYYYLFCLKRTFGRKSSFSSFLARLPAVTAEEHRRSEETSDISIFNIQQYYAHSHTNFALRYNEGPI
ncbi:hypothetical protein CRG98_037361 [Punica granatum]|uniref:Uncharacterized protein n=1 Tax=Punica granatum TaxID=22663 RepID=A0A2I0IE05_PUNGR|nr:hypothetical protein CRG98_037361 [Punica granatum]